MKIDRPNLRLVSDVERDSGDGVVCLDAGAEQALGRLLNLQAEASDGRIQPKPPSADETLCQRYYVRQTEIRRIADNVNRLRHAIVDLASIDLSSSQLIEAMNPAFDQPIIRERLQRAMDCLSRFAQEWQRYDARRTPGSS